MEKGHPSRLDIYIISWLLFEVILLIVLAFIPLEISVGIIFIGLLSYHPLEIAVTSFKSVIIDPVMSEKRHSVPRLLSLVLVDYIEIVLIFGIIYNFLFEHPSVWKSLNLSISFATLAGASLEKENNFIFIASISEMLLGILFVTGVIATIANYIGSKE